MNISSRPFLRRCTAHLSIILLSLLPAWGLAEVTVGGSISTNATWLAAQGPYNVASDLTINDGAVLAIEAGTVLRMGPGTNLIVNNGALRITGKSGTPVTITSAADVAGSTPAPGDWGQLVFRDNTNDANTVIEWTRIRFGSGVRIESASPTLNYTAIENHAAPALSIDLMSSPLGVGLTASGNTLNGISVPSGEVLGSVSWKLRGIPYVVSAGELSVGRKPVISSITPNTVQQGTSIDAVITGTRLSGVENVRFAGEGITAILKPGTSDTAIPVTIRAAESQPLGIASFELMTDAGLVRYETGISVVPYVPGVSVTGITPAIMRRGETQSFQISGNSLDGAQIRLSDSSGLTLSGLQTTATTASFSLAASTSATLGQQFLWVENPAVPDSSAAAIITIADALPRLYTNPSLLSAAPDGTAQSFSLLLTNSDSVPHTVSLSTSDPTVATVSPASINIPAGSRQAAFSVTGFKAGLTLLNLTSATLAPATVQVYVASPANGASVGPVLSAPVGINVTSSQLGPIYSSPVGLIVTSAEKGLISSPVGVTVTEGVQKALSAPVGVEVTKQ